MIRRINLFAGPGAGKSALSSWLFSELKVKGHEVEHVAEYCKSWAFIGRIPKSFDQIYIFSKQMHREDIALRDTKSITVTESPIFLSACYAKKYKAPCHKQLLELIDAFEYKYPSLNVFIDRKDCKYKQVGRFQDYKQAIQMDRVIRKALDEHGIIYHTLAYNDRQGLLDLVASSIG